MMPDNELSTEPVRAAYVGARALSVTKTVDYEDGGKDIQDVSEGLLFQRWRARLFRAGTVDSYVMLDAATVPEFVVLEQENMTEVSFSFDQAMRPAIAFMQDGVSKLYWYDSTVPGMTITEIGEGIITPRITYDDKRYIASRGYLISDLVLAYVLDDDLYIRIQRDRFTIPYLLAEDVKPLIKIGFSRELRLQFMHEAF
jgi:hypothetical protein